MNIYQRLLKITQELKGVQKGLTVGSGSYGYKAVGEMDILNAVKPLEIEHGVYSYPHDRKLVLQETLQTEKSGKVTTKFMMRVETTYRFVNVDKPEEYVDQVSYGDGVDTLDKSPGKAMTYSDKYSLMKAYKIMTGDDPDQFHSKDTTVTSQGLHLTLLQKDKIINLVQEEKIILKGVLDYYNVSSVDELTHIQAKQVIKKGESK